MFEQLIETEPQVAETGNRKNYFIVSSVSLVALLFAAIVFSIFAVDLNLDLDDLDMVSLLAPIEVTEQKLPDTLTAPRNRGGGPSKAATRQEAIARLDESPREVPTTISAVKNSSKERPNLSQFEIGKFDSEQVGGTGSGRGDGSGDGEGDGLGEETTPATVAVKDAEPPPPPVVKAAPVKEKPIIQSKGVVNSLAKSLPKPSVPVAAKVAKVSGTVTVQVLVDEKGRVVSANAVSGNALLRASCEIAARNAQFTPTLLSGEPIKISGVINYHFNADGSAE